MRAWSGFFCLVVLFALTACGDDDSGPGVPIDGGGTDAGKQDKDAGDDAAVTMMTGGRGGHGGSGGHMAPEDAGPDAAPFNPFVDAGSGNGTGGSFVPSTDPGP